MPVYSVLTSRKLKEKQKELSTNVVTDVHCSVTGAPPEFVAVMFMSGYHLKEGYKTMLLGSIRIGGTRTPEVIENLEQELIQGLAEVLDLNVTEVGVQFLEVKPNWVLEGGEVLPVPGEESEWMDKNKSFK